MKNLKVNQSVPQQLSQQLNQQLNQTSSQTLDQKLKQHTGFPPVFNKRTHTLILGSFPGEASLHAAQYYAYPQNQFWRLLEAIIHEPLTELPYSQKLVCLLDSGFGLWDVIANARRVGSLDSNIREHTRNDLLALVDILPRLETIAFNGGTAAKIGIKALEERAQRYRILRLPSSSPAHASLTYSQKLESWRALTV